METVDRRAACLLASKTGSIRHKEIPGWMMQAVNEEKLLRLVLKTTEHAHEMGWPANACGDAGFNAKECREHQLRPAGRFGSAPTATRYTRMLILIAPLKIDCILLY